jgi:hypothetical protein
LLVSYYDGRDGVAPSQKYRSMLTVSTLAGTGIKTVYFHTEDVPLGGHAGALAVGRGNLYVGTTEGKPRVTRIPLTKIARAENTATLPNPKTYSTAAASTPRSTEVGCSSATSRTTGSTATTPRPRVR